MRKSDLFFNVIRLPVDFVMLIAAGLVTYLFRTEIISVFRPVLFEFNLPIIKYLYLLIFVSLLFIGSYAVSGLYSMKMRLRIMEELSRIIVASSAGIMLVIIYIFLRQELFNSRFLVLGGWFFAIWFVFTGRMVIRKIQAIVVAKYNFGVHKLVIVGNNDTATKLVSSIQRNPSLGYRVFKILPNLDLDIIKSMIDKHELDEIIFTQHYSSIDEISDIVSLCQEGHVAFKFIPTIPQLFTSHLDLDILHGVPVIEIKRTRLEGWGKVIKRTIDILGALSGLILLLPLFGIIALAIKWESEGPVFVKLKRISGAKNFGLYKFRGMIENAEELKPYLVSLNERKDGPLFKIKDDPRITRVGKLIRRFRLDELPQLYNAFRGDISLVGPRPHQPDEIEMYDRHHKKVLAIKGGITGLAQISGSSDISFEEEVALDTFYIDNWSLWMDIRILVKTGIKMLWDKSAV